MGNPQLIFDLSKAGRNLSKLVPKQVQVSRNGRTFMQTVYVDPSTGQPPTQASTSPIDFQEFMRLAYGDKDRAKAMKYLEDNGVTWNKSSHDGVNWMRAAMAAQTAAGLAPTAAQSAPVSKPTAATSGASTAAGGTQKKGGKIDYQKLAAAGYDKADGKTKVAMLKQMLGKDDFLVLARVMTHWDSSPHDGVNYMRASMAMTQWCSANDLDYLSQHVSGQHLDTTTADLAANAQAPAPKGSKAKTQTPAAPPPPPKPKDELEAKATHTPRQQGIIKAINAISDPQVLRGLATVGIVPEDADAQTFVLDRLRKEYDIHIRPSLNGTGGYNHQNYYNNRDLRKAFAKRTSKVFKGVHQKVVDRATQQIVQPEMLYDFVDPRSGVTISAMGRRGYGQHTNAVSLLRDLGNTFGGYAGVDAPDGHTSYTSKWDRDKARWGNSLASKAILDSETSAQIFDPEKEGVVRALRAIGTSDPKLKAKADEMEAIYLDMVKAVGYNPTMILNALGSDLTSIREDMATHQGMVDRTLAIKEYLKTTYGMTDEDVAETFKRNHFYGKVNRFSLWVHDPNNPTRFSPMWDDPNSSTRQNVYADLSSLTDPQTGEILFPDPRQYILGGWSSYISYDIAEAALSTGKMPAIYDYSALTDEAYDTVIYGMAKLMGVKFIDHNTQAPVDPSIAPHEYTSSQWSEVETIKDGDDAERDAILTNLSFLLNVAEVNNQIANNITDCPQSAANKQGNDYSGNFRWVRSDKSDSYQTYGYDAPQMTATEKSDIMLRQLQAVPFFSLDDLKTLGDYVQSNGDPNQSLGYGSSANETLSRILSLSPQQQGFDGIIGTPIDEVYQRYTEAALQYCPQVYTTRVTDDKKMRAWARKTMGFVPYASPTLNPADFDPSGGTPLYQLRQSLFKAAHCTLRTADAQEYDDITHRVKMDFDYVDPATGKRVEKAKRAYDDRSLALHGKAYIISNSEAEERFAEEAIRLKEQPTRMYHGTSYGGAAGIIGVDGKFRISGKDTNGLQVSGSMLGQGIYMAKMVGKTLPYMGNQKYSYKHYKIDQQPGPTAGFASDGCLLVCDALLGKHYHTDSSTIDAQQHNDGTYDSVAVGAGASMGGATLKEYECIVRRNNQVLPKFIVDCGGRVRR